MRRFLWVLVFAGCSNPPTCKQALVHAGPLFGLEVIDATIAVCEQHGWSADVRTCFASATSQSDTARCIESVKLDMTAMLMKQADQAQKQSESAARDAERAHEQRQDAINRAKAASEALDKLANDLSDLAAKIDVAVAVVAGAHGQAQLDAARANLERLQHERAELQKRIDAAQGSGL